MHKGGTGMDRGVDGDRCQDSLGRSALAMGVDELAVLVDGSGSVGEEL